MDLEWKVFHCHIAYQGPRWYKILAPKNEAWNKESSATEIAKFCDFQGLWYTCGPFGCVWHLRKPGTRKAALDEHLHWIYWYLFWNHRWFCLVAPVLPHMGISINGATPSYHPFLDGILSYKPSSYGDITIYGNPTCMAIFPMVFPLKLQLPSQWLRLILVGKSMPMSLTPREEWSTKGVNTKKKNNYIVYRCIE